MTDLWPWLAVAGTGAVHGLNPATAWAFAAARGVRSDDPADVLRALVPLCMGDAAVRQITASGSLALALGTVGVHVAAMLAVSGAIALVACVGLRRSATRAGRSQAFVAACGLHLRAHALGLQAALLRAERRLGGPARRM